MYYDQVERYINVFGSNNIKILLIEDLKSDLIKSVTSIIDFLDLDSNFKFDTIKHNTYKTARNKFIKTFFQSNTLRKFLRYNLSDKNKNFLKSMLFKNTQNL